MNHVCYVIAYAPVRSSDFTLYLATQADMHLAEPEWFPTWSVSFTQGAMKFAEEGSLWSEGGVWSVIEKLVQEHGIDRDQLRPMRTTFEV